MSEFLKKTVAVYMHTHIIMNHKVEIVQEANSLFIFPLLWECIIYVIAIISKHSKFRVCQRAPEPTWKAANDQIWTN